MIFIRLRFCIDLSRLLFEKTISSTLCFSFHLATKHRFDRENSWCFTSVLSSHECWNETRKIPDRVDRVDENIFFLFWFVCDRFARCRSEMVDWATQDRLYPSGYRPADIRYRRASVDSSLPFSVASNKSNCLFSKKRADSADSPRTQLSCEDQTSEEQWTAVDSYA